MIFEIGKGAVASLFLGKVFKGTHISQKRNFIYPVRCYAVFQKRVDFGSKSFSQATLPRNSNFSKVLKYFFSSDKVHQLLDRGTFETVCSETLDSLTDYFEELIETVPKLRNADVHYNDGVLTVNLGEDNGTYVINRQGSNLQIWLSSPKSGPKRYDYIQGTWVYKQDKSTLHSLLNQEIREFISHEVNFIEKCLHAKASL